MQPVNQIDNLAASRRPARLRHRRAAVQDGQGLRQLAGARASQLPVLFDTRSPTCARASRPASCSRKALMVKVIPQLDALIKDKPEDTLFWGPIKKMPAGFSDADKTAPDRGATATMIERPADAGLPPAAHLHQRRVPAGHARHRRPATRCPMAGLVRVQRTQLDHDRHDPGADPPDRPGRSRAHPRRDPQGHRADRLQGLD